jgi:hypothetical protein
MRTKMAMMVALATVLMAALLGGVGGAGAALARTIGGVIQCDEVPCVATGNHQVLFERIGDGVRDRMIAQASNDHLNAEAYTDDRDVAKGGGGHDSLLVDDGDTMDGAIGGPGYDVCVVDATIEAADTCERVVVH